VSVGKTFATAGNYWLIGEASNGTTTVRDSVWMVVKKEVETLTRPSNTRAGINVQDACHVLKKVDTFYWLI
ncbi:MAG TPA: hypothetical protein VF870_13105, partial [Ignavibacteriaceae bacterium]